MICESCQSLCAIALASHKHTQVWLREDTSGCIVHVSIAPGRVLIGFSENVPQATKHV